MIRTAYLRAYVPSSVVPDLPPFRQDGDETPTITASEAFIWQEPTTDDAIYTTWNSAQYVCPRNVKLRMLEGVLAFTKTYPMLPVISAAV